MLRYKIEETSCKLNIHDAKVRNIRLIHQKCNLIEQNQNINEYTF
jgi:hypothetical protein